MDLWDRRSPGQEADQSLTDERVARVLERLRAKGECPGVIRSDNGPEFTGKALDRWAQAASVKLEFIRPGKPTDNSHVASFNDRFREECLDAQMFSTLDEARKIIEAWRQDYNTARPQAPLAASALKSTEEPGVGKPIGPESELWAGILGGVKSVFYRRMVELQAFNFGNGRPFSPCCSGPLTQFPW